jgi:hypothetical protein
VSLIDAANSPGAHAAISATKTVPIVMVKVGDPVAMGFVTNLARPGARPSLRRVDSVSAFSGWTSVMRTTFGARPRQ